MAQLERLKHRLYVAATLTCGHHHTLSDDAHHYLRHVLRLKSGTLILSFDNSNCEYVSEYICDSKKVGRLLIGELVRTQNTQTPELHLGACLLKGSTFDTVLQKATELGVSHIWSLTSARTEVRINAERMAKKLNHWRSVVISASEQSGRLSVPQVGSVQPLSDFMTKDTTTVKLMLDPTANNSINQAKVVDTTLLVGPEGGFTAEELSQCGQNNYQRWRLGDRILRADTAAVAGLVALQHMMGWPE